MIIDNGEKLPLIIDGVFDGLAGVSGAHVAFVPNLIGRKPESATRGTLDGSPVALTVARQGKTPLCIATVRPLPETA